MKPSGTPEPPQGCPLTPRVTSIRRVRELGIADFNLPIDDHLLCELLPFDHSTDGDGNQWIALRATVDIPGTPASVEKSGWLVRDELELLPHLRELIREAPRDLRPLFAISSFERGRTEQKRRHPSARTRREIRPTDGLALLTAWREGRRPVLRTVAFIECALPHVPEVHEGCVLRALQILHERSLQRDQREEVIAALDGLAQIVDGWINWPGTPGLEALNPFPDGFFDGVDLEELFDADETEDPEQDESS